MGGKSAMSDTTGAEARCQKCHGCGRLLIPIRNLARLPLLGHSMDWPPRLVTRVPDYFTRVEPCLCTDGKERTIAKKKGAQVQTQHDMARFEPNATIVGG